MTPNAWHVGSGHNVAGTGPFGASLSPGLLSAARGPDARSMSPGWKRHARASTVPRVRRRWLWTSWAMLFLSVIGAAMFGGLWRSSVESQQRHAFDAEAVGVASTVGTALRRM